MFAAKRTASVTVSVTRLQIVTADVEGAETNAAINLRLTGDEGDSGIIGVFDVGHGSCVRGKVKSVLLPISDIGKMSSLNIMLDVRNDDGMYSTALTPLFFCYIPRIA